jgi:hypothetical protein
LGLLLLGPRPKGANYTRREVEALQGIATEVAHAIVLSGRATRTEIPLGA